MSDLNSKQLVPSRWQTTAFLLNISVDARFLGRASLLKMIPTMHAWIITPTIDWEKYLKLHKSEVGRKQLTVGSIKFVGKNEISVSRLRCSISDSYTGPRPVFLSLLPNSRATFPSSVHSRITNFGGSQGRMRRVTAIGFCPLFDFQLLLRFFS